MFLNVCNETFHRSHVRISQKVRVALLWNIQHVIFIWRGRYWQIFRFSNLHCCTFKFFKTKWDFWNETRLLFWNRDFSNKAGFLFWREIFIIEQDFYSRNKIFKTKEELYLGSNIIKTKKDFYLETRFLNLKLKFYLETGFLNLKLRFLKVQSRKLKKHW